MERLTYRDENGKAWANIKNNYTAREAQEFGRIALEQLAAYEDSGLSPEEVHKLVKVLKQARESLQAAWEDEGSTTVGKQILETIKAIDELLKGE